MEGVKRGGEEGLRWTRGGGGSDGWLPAKKMALRIFREDGPAKEDDVRRSVFYHLLLLPPASQLRIHETTNIFTNFGH